MGVGALVVCALNARVISSLSRSTGDFDVAESEKDDREGDDPMVDPMNSGIQRQTTALRKGSEIPHGHQWFRAKSPEFYVKLQEEITERHAAVAKAHSLAAVAESQQESRPNTIDIAFSLKSGDDLPSWAHDVLSGSWGEGLSLTVYVKTEGVGRDEEVVLERREGFEKVAIANLGRNEHAYVKHLSRRYKTLADVQILTKTNLVSPEMVKSMVDANRNGTYGFISHPWRHARRYLSVRCDRAWENHTLFPDLCGSEIRGGSVLANEFPGWMIIRPARVQRSNDCDLSWPLFSNSQRLPFLHEAYGEGMFSIRRDVLTRFPHDWYLMWENITYQCVDGSIQYDVKHHDDAMIEVFSLAFSKEDGMSDFPAYHISPSTVSLFDKSSYCRTCGSDCLDTCSITHTYCGINSRTGDPTYCAEPEARVDTARTTWRELQPT
jgi:hypothetical protein